MLIEPDFLICRKAEGEYHWRMVSLSSTMNRIDLMLIADFLRALSCRNPVVKLLYEGALL